MTAATAPTLTERRDRLEARLTDGWHRINEAEAKGRDITAWEELWLNLLHEYEDVCDQILLDSS